MAGQAWIGRVPNGPKYVLAMLITLGAIVTMVFIAGRIYAGGLLQFGGKVKVREAWRFANQ